MRKSVQLLHRPAIVFQRYGVSTLILLEQIIDQQKDPEENCE